MEIEIPITFKVIPESVFGRFVKLEEIVAFNVLTGAVIRGIRNDSH